MKISWLGIFHQRYLIIDCSYSLVGDFVEIRTGLGGEAINFGVKNNYMSPWPGMIISSSRREPHSVAKFVTVTHHSSCWYEVINRQWC